MKLLEKKLFIQDEYLQGLETSNNSRASFLRGKLSLIDELLKEMEVK